MHFIDVDVKGLISHKNRPDELSMMIRNYAIVIVRIPKNILIYLEVWTEMNELYQKLRPSNFSHATSRKSASVSNLAHICGIDLQLLPHWMQFRKEISD